MKYIIGLGNPGIQYSETYHNLGLIFANWLCQTYPHETLAKKSEYELLKFRDFHLIKPNTYMNTSFKALESVYHFYKLKPENILVMHDELMLPKYEVKLRTLNEVTPGNAGHNGLRNLSEHISPHFTRLRIGIDHPKNFDARIDVTNYVLSHIDDLAPYKKAFETKGIELIQSWLGQN